MKNQLEEVQSLPEVPAIAHFCSLFHAVLGLNEFPIEQLENALVDCSRPAAVVLKKPAKNEFHGDGSDSQKAAEAAAVAFLDDLLVKLVRGCLPRHAKFIHKHNYLTYTKQLFQTKAEELEEDYGDNKNLLSLMTMENPFEAADNDVEELADLNLAARVRVLRLVTDFRLEAEDIPARLKDMDPDSLRVTPLGEDSRGQIYWYFYGTRLYLEVLRRNQKKKKNEVVESKDKVKGKMKSKETKTTKKQGSSKKKSSSTLLNDDDEEEEESEGPGPGWYLVCQTEADWQRLADRLRHSRKKQDRELLSTLETDFLPEIGRMFAQQEREERLRLLMANKRSSSRIELQQRREQEERQLLEQQLEQQLAMAQQLEEERRADQEKENGPRTKRENRAAQRGGNGDEKVGGVAVAEDREERKRRREAQQDVLRRWQEMEMDHDYLPAKQRRHFHFY